MWYKCTLLHINDLKKNVLYAKVIDGVLATLQNDIWYFDKPGLRDLEFGGMFYGFFSAESGLSSLVVISISPPMLSNP